MDKTERLFSLLDALRRRRTPVTAEVLSAEQEVSVRTIYRDVQTLIGLGAPIEGEAGLGYVLKSGFFMPPLMFKPDELEALVLGARWVQTLPDKELGEAAKNALAKIATASPDDLRARIEDPGIWPVNLDDDRPAQPILGCAREAMRREVAAQMKYKDSKGNVTERTIWPVQLGYFEGKQIIAAYCCLREDYRFFRVDRMLSFELSNQPYGTKRSIMTKEWFEVWLRQRRAQRDELTRKSEQ